MLLIGWGDATTNDAASPRASRRGASGFEFLGGWWQLMRGRIELDLGHVEHSRAAFARWRTCDLAPDYQLRAEAIQGLGELVAGETERASGCLDAAIPVSLRYSGIQSLTSFAT